MKNGGGWLAADILEANWESLVQISQWFKKFKFSDRSIKIWRIFPGSSLDGHLPIPPEQIYVKYTITLNYWLSRENEKIIILFNYFIKSEFFDCHLIMKNREWTTAVGGGSSMPPSNWLMIKIKI